MQLKAPRVVVRKSSNTLELYDGGTLVKRYACITGSNAGDKEKEGDRKTPVGTFHIVYKNPESKFHLSLGLDYPTAEDAERGLAAGVITEQQRDDIVAALGSDLSKAENQKKLWYTPLGGEIFLHGHGEGRAGTAGCVALSNGDIEELWAVLPVGTEVRIEP
jgi:murein L,D-transpeptidase YafK